MNITQPADVEAYALQTFFLCTGVFVIANVAATMQKAVFKLCALKEPEYCWKRSSMSELNSKHCNNGSSYCEKNCLSVLHWSKDGLRKRNAVSSIANNTAKPATSNCNVYFMKEHSPSAVHDNEENNSYHLMLIKLFYVCCVFETVYIIVKAMFSDDIRYAGITKKICNISAPMQDCIMLNTIVLVQKTCLSSVLDAVDFMSLSLFPVIVCLTSHYFKSYFKHLVSAIIILVFVLLSRCLGFLFFPHFLLPVNCYTYTLQSVLSSCLVCVSMVIGTKLTFNDKLRLTQMGTEDHTKAQCFNCIGPSAWKMFGLKNSYLSMTHREGRHHAYAAAFATDLYQDKATASEGAGAKTNKKGSTFHGSKRYMRKPSPDMAFGSDAFVPCVVLMRKPNANPYRQTVCIGTSARPPRTPRRASLDVIKENKTIEDAIKWSEVMHKRRTSLPTILAGSKKKAVMSSVLVDTTTLIEVHAIVDELSKKPANFSDLIKKLEDCLNPYKLDHVKPRQVVWLQKNGDGLDEEAVCLSPRHVSLKRTQQRRSDWQSGLFSTTTTATGLPKEEPGPLKPKRLPKISKDKTPMSTPRDSRCSSPVNEGPGFYDLSRRRTYPSIPLSHSTKFSFNHHAHHHHSVTKKLSQISSDYESDEPSSLSVPPPPVTRSKSVSDETDGIPSVYHYHQENLTLNSCSTNTEHFVRSISTPPVSENSVILEEEERSGRHGNQCTCEVKEDGHALFLRYQEKVLESVYDWNFQIFELAENTNCVLSQMAFKLFQDTGLFETFNIPKKEFVCYMKALESGYREIPYHNQIHAADVLHGCWFLSTQEIPGFHDHSPLFSSDSSDSDSGTSSANTRQVNNIGHGSLAQAIPALELMSLYLAAAMHDYDHPGRTNAFLVETRHPLAIFYNDRSVLENHHAAASWDLLYSNKNFDFLKNLETAEWKRLRFLIVEAILATDLKKHFQILSQFSAKSQQSLSRSTSTEDGDIADSPRTGINWSADEDRLLVCQMVIKLADIGGPAKIKPIHITWTKAICEEFFIQGDEERSLKVPVSPFMDREKPQVAELQRTFINNLIKPILVSMNKAGVLAGEIPEDHDLWTDKPQSPEKNLLLGQLKSNLNFWKTKTSLSGHEEMQEAFKIAYPLCLGNEKSSETNAVIANPSEDVVISSQKEHLDKSLKVDGEFLENIAEHDDHIKTSSTYDIINTSPAEPGRLKFQHPKLVVSNSSPPSVRSPFLMRNDV